MRIHARGQTHADLDQPELRLTGYSRPDRLPDTPDLVRAYQQRQHEVFARNQREIKTTWGFLAVILILVLMVFCYNAGIARQERREAATGVRL